MRQAASINRKRFLFLVTWRPERERGPNDEVVWRGTLEGRSAHQPDKDPTVVRICSLDELPNRIREMLNALGTD
jgi:hypothetical protein